MSGWDPDAPGVIALPSGRLVRGRRRRTLPAGPLPEYGLYLAGRRPPTTRWPARWLPWRDFRLPTDLDAARNALVDAWERSAGERVEVACAGGRGRTGTALACLAVLDGVPAGQAVNYVRQRYDKWAVETPAQRRYVSRFDGRLGTATGA